MHKSVHVVVGMAGILVMFCGILSCTAMGEGEPLMVKGVWKITKIELLDGSAPVNDDPLPSLVIFTARHYSMVWLQGTDAKRAFTERWYPTDEEKIERYGAFIVNTGTYEVVDTILTMHPIVARVPEFMGGRFVHKVVLSVDRLQLTSIDEYSYDGVQTPWVKSGGGEILTLVRVEE